MTQHELNSSDSNDDFASLVSSIESIPLTAQFQKLLPSTARGETVLFNLV